jgi:serralysin
MANATAFVSTSMPDLTVWYGNLKLANSSRIIIDDDAGRRTEYSGSFNYSSAAVFGTLDAVSEFRNGITIYSVENIGADATQMFQAIQLLGDFNLAASIVLQNNDAFNGSSGADNIRAYAGNDLILSGGGNDTLSGMSGNDTLDGGTGIDTAGYSGNQASYTLTLSPNSTSIADRRFDGNGTDQLINIELLDFDTGISGTTFNLQQFAGPAGLSQETFESFIELYIAYFNRAPDAVGLNFWGTAFANGMTLEEIAMQFINQDETRATYPTSLSNADFATAVYNNVLGRIPDQAGFDFWVGVLDSGASGRDQFILSVLGGVQDGSPDRVYLDNKIDVGAYFAVHKGMSDVANASAAMALFDGTQSGIDSAVSAIDGFYQDALDPTNGEFLMQVVGILDDPFAVA